MTRTVYRERIPSSDPRLSRHVYHDSESRRYEFPTTGLSIQSAVHRRSIPILDQGQVGSCTAEAGIGTLGTDPHYAAVTALARPRYELTQAGAYALYSDEEILDGSGPYPPNDSGSTGLTCAKVLKSAGMISGYQHTFSLDAALKALGVTPILLGVPWYQDMFNPDPDGRLHITGALAGGHEIEAREIDATRQRVWIDNSWGDSWGVAGRAYLTFADLGTLLDQQGDVTILTPLSQPAPTPTPTPAPTPAPAPVDADHQLVTALSDWAAKCHRGANKRAADAFKAWRTAKGL